jgi:hypothetical protein
MCATSVIFKPLPKVNNHPLRENSPDLATLLVSHLLELILVDPFLTNSAEEIAMAAQEEVGVKGREFESCRGIG